MSDDMEPQRKIHIRLHVRKHNTLHGLVCERWYCVVFNLPWSPHYIGPYRSYIGPYRSTPRDAIQGLRDVKVVQ